MARKNSPKTEAESRVKAKKHENKSGLLRKMWFSKKDENSTFPKWHAQENHSINRKASRQELNDERTDNKIRQIESGMESKLEKIQKNEDELGSILKQILIETREEHDKMRKESQELLSRLESLSSFGIKESESAPSQLQSNEKENKGKHHFGFRHKGRKEPNYELNKSLNEKKGEYEFENKKTAEEPEEGQKITQTERQESQEPAKKTILSVVYEMPEENDESKKSKAIKPANHGENSESAKSDEYETRSDKNNIKTSLDVLMDLINSQGSVKVTEAAKKLHVKDRQIEEWAHMLEGHGLIDVHYPTFGKSVLKKKTESGASNAR